MDFIDCPQCGHRIAAPAEWNLENSRRRASMTLREQIFSALIILLVIFLLMSISVFYFMVIPRMDEPAIYYYLISLFALGAIVFTFTTAANLHHSSLLVIPTIVQCVMLLLMIYTIPLGLWGFYLLAQRSKSLEMTPANSEVDSWPD
jgi:hypothetical protein